MVMSPVGVNHDLWLEINDFVIYEARLLDDRKFHDWLDLLTDDLFYFMPRKKNRQRKDMARETTPLGDLAMFEEDKESMKMRIARLDTGMAWAEDPPSRTRHFVTNLQIEDLGNDEVKANVAFLLYRTHLEHDEDFFVGSREDVLRKVNGEWKIAKRTIVLDANVIHAKNLSVFF
jgi:3-phenylpropionate/cinnamic acid dioxygenase small subunit